MIQKGVPADADTTITPPPKVIESAREVIVGPITPKYAGGGYAPADLNPSDKPGVESFYVLVGPDGVRRPFALVDIDTGRPFGTVIKLMSLDRKVPF